METEILRSKNELMTLNNQLLEAVQSRLEMSIELEAWKVCLIAHLMINKKAFEYVSKIRRQEKGKKILERLV